MQLSRIPNGAADLSAEREAREAANFRRASQAYRTHTAKTEEAMLAHERERETASFVAEYFAGRQSTKRREELQRRRSERQREQEEEEARWQLASQADVKVLRYQSPANRRLAVWDGLALRQEETHVPVVAPTPQPPAQFRPSRAEQDREVAAWRAGVRNAVADVWPLAPSADSSLRPKPRSPGARPHASVSVRSRCVGGCDGRSSISHAAIPLSSDDGGWSVRRNADGGSLSHAPLPPLSSAAGGRPVASDEGTSVDGRSVRGGDDASGSPGEVDVGAGHSEADFPQGPLLQSPPSSEHAGSSDASPDASRNQGLEGMAVVLAHLPVFERNMMQQFDLNRHASSAWADARECAVTAPTCSGAPTDRWLERLQPGFFHQPLPSARLATRPAHAPIAAVGACTAAVGPRNAAINAPAARPAAELIMDPSWSVRALVLQSCHTEEVEQRASPPRERVEPTGDASPERRHAAAQRAHDRAFMRYVGQPLRAVRDQRSKAVMLQRWARGMLARRAFAAMQLEHTVRERRRRVARAAAERAAQRAVMRVGHAAQSDAVLEARQRRRRVGRPTSSTVHAYGHQPPAYYPGWCTDDDRPPSYADDRLSAGRPPLWSHMALHQGLVESAGDEQPTSLALVDEYLMLPREAGAFEMLREVHVNKAPGRTTSRQAHDQLGWARSVMPRPELEGRAIGAPPRHSIVSSSAAQRQSHTPWDRQIGD